MKVLVFLFAAICILSGCGGFSSNSNEDEFYTSTKTGDLWRVPLIKPYELVSPTNSNLNDWFLIISSKNLQGKDFFKAGAEFQFTSIQQIGIKDSIIVVSNDQQFWPLLSGQYPSTLIIDATTDEFFIYSNTHHAQQIEAKIKALKVETIEMLNWNDVLNNFQKKQRLPESWNVD